MRLLAAHGIGTETGTSYTTSEPVSMVSSSHAASIVRDTSESSWEEIERMAAKESNMTANALLVMALAGMIAAVGIATNALHVVIGAMVIAPGFQPISRIGLGLVAQSPAWRRGLWDTLRGYAVLVAVAALTSLLLDVLGEPALGGGASYLQPGALVSFWMTNDETSFLVTLAAATAGVVLVATNRSVLTAGVMIALALVPSAALVGMALVQGATEVAGDAAARWLVDAVLLFGVSIAVFGWKRARVHRRPLMY